jgi:LuxR family maltose regulon positive regulatory protein
VLRSTHSFKVGDLGKAAAAARDVLALDADAPFPEFVAHCLLGVTSYWRGAPRDAAASLERALALAEHESNELGQSYALGYLALARAELGEAERAEELAGRAIRLGDVGGFAEHFVPMVGHLARGRLEERRGELEPAERTLSRALALARRGAGALELGSALVALAQVRYARADRDGSAELLMEARATLEDCPDAGSVGPSLEVAERALRAPSRAAPRSNGRRDELTEREIAVLRLLDGELSRREIADALYVSLDTVKTHIRGIYRKLGARSREEAVADARRRGLI